MNRAILLFVSILIVFIAGCISQDKVIGNQNVVPDNQTIVGAKNLTDQDINATKKTNLTEKVNATIETTPYISDSYTLDKPVDWEIEENEDFTYFKSPPQENQTDLQEYVVVYTKPLEPEDLVLKDFFQDSIGTMMSTSTGFAVINFSEYQLDDVPAYKILYSEGEQGSELSYLQVFAVKDSNGYILTYTAPAETFNESLPEAEAIIDSYRLT